MNLGIVLIILIVMILKTITDSSRLFRYVSRKSTHSQFRLRSADRFKMVTSGQSNRVKINLSVKNTESLTWKKTEAAEDTNEPPETGKIRIWQTNYASTHDQKII